MGLDYLRLVCGLQTALLPVRLPARTRGYESRVYVRLRATNGCRRGGGGGESFSGCLLCNVW